MSLQQAIMATFILHDSQPQSTTETATPACQNSLAEPKLQKEASLSLQQALPMDDISLIQLSQPEPFTKEEEKKRSCSNPVPARQSTGGSLSSSTAFAAASQSEQTANAPLLTRLFVGFKSGFNTGYSQGVVAGVAFGPLRQHVTHRPLQTCFHGLAGSALPRYTDSFCQVQLFFQKVQLFLRKVQLFFWKNRILLALKCSTSTPRRVMPRSQ